MLEAAERQKGRPTTFSFSHESGSSGSSSLFAFARIQVHGRRQQGSDYDLVSPFLLCHPLCSHVAAGVIAAASDGISSLRTPILSGMQYRIALILFSSSICLFFHCSLLYGFGGMA